jgi:DNA-binding transcriptional MerR regulator
MKIWAIILAASVPLFGQSSGSTPDKPQNHVNVLDVSQIVRQSIAATERSWDARDHYLYTERDEDRRLDSDGRVKSEDVDVSKIIFVNEAPFEQLVERNGRPPSPEEQRKQAEQVDKLKRETPQERVARLRQQQENRSFIREVPEGFDFQLVGEEVVNRRPAYVLRATPRAGYRARGTYGKLMSKVEGKLWVDKQDFGWVKVDGEVTQPFSMGLFLARVLRGSHITMEQTRFEDGVWMPNRIEMQASARILFVKSYGINRILAYSHYQPMERASLASVPSWH